MLLTQKETTLLQDMKTQEEVCIEKYNKYSNDACDAELQDLFSSIEKVERQHLDTINKMMAGTVPPMTGGPASPKAPTKASYNLGSDTESKKNDEFLCNDSLSMEKHVSSVYDTSIFEFKDTHARDMLNHIQKEEQEHGDQISKYMELNGMTVK